MVENTTIKGNSLSKEEYLQRLFDNKSVVNFARVIDSEGAKECKKVIGSILNRNIEGINKMLANQTFAGSKKPRFPEVRLTAIDYECVKRWFLYCTPKVLQDDVKRILNNNIIYAGMQTGLTEYKATKLNRHEQVKYTQMKTSISKAFNGIAHLVFSKVASMEDKK